MKLQARGAAPIYERKAKMPPKVTKPLPAFALVPPTAAGVPFDTSKGCMWPLWGPEATKGHVCGQDQLILEEGTKRERRSSYCDAHHRRAYPSYTPKK